MSLIEGMPSDAAEFLARANAIVALALRPHVPEVYLLRIDNWFGARWAGFGGKVLGLAGVHFRSDLPLPPFVPARVIQQTCHRYDLTKQQYTRVECARELHVEQSSSANLRRRIDQILPTAAVIWFSGNSAVVSRGSVMAYVPSETGHHAWYADFDGSRSWRAVERIGLTKRELELSPQPQPA